MKRLILSELILLFLATAFIGDNPPGWYQQVLPVNDVINDIFFLDSLTGWVVTDGRTNTNDTGYILKTINGGSNWSIQYSQPMKLTAIQFSDVNTGYAAGGSGSGTGRLFKTTNSGQNWNLIYTAGTLFNDVVFINKDTGWVCDDDASFGVGIMQTVNGGVNWQQQAPPGTRPKKLFFINKDTGWAISNEASSKLYRTLNGGANWNLQFTFTAGIEGIFFVSRDTGWVTGGGGGTGIMRTINGGFNWFSANNPTPFGSSQIFFINNKRGWAGSGLSKIVATVDGENWGYQTTPNFTHYNVLFIDTLKGWAGGGGNDIIHTTDGGGPVGIKQISNEIPNEFKLFQNYPNPFNPVTNIKYSLPLPSKGGENVIKLVVYDITGREIATLVNVEQSPGTYKTDFDGSAYSSGVYFYSLIVDGKLVDTKKMLLVK